MPAFFCDFSFPSFTYAQMPRVPPLQNPSLKCWEEKHDLLQRNLMHYLMKRFGNKIYMRKWVTGSTLLPLSFLFSSWFFLFLFPSFVFSNLFEHFLTGRHFSVGCYGRRKQKRYILHIQNTLIHGWNANPYNRIIIGYLHWNCTHGFVIILINLDLNEAKLFCMAAELIYVI